MSGKLIMDAQNIRSSVITLWLILTLNHQLMAKTPLLSHEQAGEWFSGGKKTYAFKGRGVFLRHCENVSKCGCTQTHRPRVITKLIYNLSRVIVSFQLNHMKGKHITPNLGLNSRLQLDCTSWSSQWYHQYPSSSLLYCSFAWQCSSLSNNGTGSSWNWQRALQHTQSHIISPFFFFLLHLSTISASSYFALSFSLLPLCRSLCYLISRHFHPLSLPSLSTLACLLSFHLLLFLSPPRVWMDWQLLFPHFTFGSLLFS